MVHRRVRYREATATAARRHSPLRQLFPLAAVPFSPVKSVTTMAAAKDRSLRQRLSSPEATFLPGNLSSFPTPLPRVRGLGFLVKWNIVPSTICNGLEGVATPAPMLALVVTSIAAGLAVYFIFQAGLCN